MPDKQKTNSQTTVTESGTLKRPEAREPQLKRESAKPTTLPEYFEEHGATTGMYPVPSEGEANSATMDDDPATGR